MSLKSVAVPVGMEPLFAKAEEYVKDYFSSYRADREHGTITIGGERYILVRAKSLRVDFAKHIGDIMGLSDEMAESASSNFLYMLARSIGQEDAKHFISSQNVVNPIERLAAGPIAFNYAGWAFVDIFPESRPSTDDNYLLIYDHPYSFEADAYIQAKGATAANCICVMNAGYSSGWCSESFGVDVDAKEIMCKARGDAACRFVMGKREKLEEYESLALNITR